jgi:hypothetical protein
MRSIFYCCVLLSSAGIPALAGEPAHTGIELSDLVRVFDNERSSVSQFYDLPFSLPRMDRMETLYRDWLDKLRKSDFDNLNQPGRVDYVLLRSKIEHELARIQRDRGRLAEIDELMPFRSALQDFEQKRWRMATLDAPATATMISDMPEQIKKLRERIEKGIQRKRGEGQRQRAGKRQREESH